MSSEGKNILILDSGLWEMKIGFAGDEVPRFLQRSVIGVPKNPAISISSGHPDVYIGNDVAPHAEVLDILRPLTPDGECQWNVLEKGWRALFYNEVKSKLDDFPLMIICSSYFTSERKMKAAELLFENFDFPSLNFQLSNVTGLYSYGRTTGLVVDSGFSRTTAVSVFEGYPIQERQIEIGFGGGSLNQTFKALLQGTIETQKSRFSNQSDFFRFYGYNFHDIFYENSRIQAYQVGKEGLSMTLPDGNEITMGKQTIEDYVQESVIRLADLIKDSAKLCEEKYKAEFLQNFYLIGGNALIPDLQSKIGTRLQTEGLKDLALVEKTPEEKIYGSWIGGSMLASLDCFPSLLVKRSDYEEYGCDVIIKRNLL